MSVQQAQLLAAILSIAKNLSASDSFLVTICVCFSSVPVVIGYFVYKAISKVADQISPLRNEIAQSGKEFASLCNEIRQQRDENRQIMANQNMLINQVVELVERVTRRLTQLENR